MSRVSIRQTGQAKQKGQDYQQPQPQLSTREDSGSIPPDDEKKKIEDRLQKFIMTFVTKFPKMLKKYENETSTSPTTTENMAEEALVDVVGELSNLASGILRASIATARYINNRNHRKKAKRVVEVFRHIEKDKLENILAEAGSDIFYSYQIQFTKITDTDGYWTRGMEKLATDAMKRAINYVNQYKKDNPDMKVSVDLITEGIILGESTQDNMITAMQKVPKMRKLGHTVKIGNKKCKTSEVYENVDLVIKDDGTVGKYYSKKCNGSDSRNSKDTTGTTQDLQKLNEDYQVIEQYKNGYEYLSLEVVKAKAKETLNKIKEEDLKNRFDNITDRPESKQVRDPIWFNMRYPVMTFTGRDNELKWLYKNLQEESTQVVISQVTVITGLGGIGKTELVRKYAAVYAGFYDNNVIGINSETHESLTTSFKELAEELNIPTSKKIGENMQEIQVNSIVKNVYKYFSDVKSLFIFDNAEDYTVIEKFLPTSLYPKAKRPYILITSRNQNWNVDDEGQIHVMQLNIFTQEEAKMFIENSIKIKDGLQKEDIEKLTERLQYFPLALRQAVAYINEEDKKSNERGNERFKISDYLKKFEEKTKELLKEGYYKNSDRYSATVLTTWTTTLEKIKEDQNHGVTAIDILYVMAYLAPDKIHTSKMFDSDSVELCYKYSMIDLKEKGMANIHRLVQEVIRLTLKDEKKEEEVLKKALKLIGDNKNISKENTSHAISIWSYASGYSNLINEFYFNSNSIPIYGYNNSTPLHLLAENSNDEAVKAILNKATLLKENFSEKFSKIIDAKDKYNRTPLYMAVENGHVSVVKLLVDKEAKIDIKSTIVYNSLTTKIASGWISLHVAAFNGYSDIVKILVNKDRTLVNVKDSTDRTAAVLAASGGQINVLKILKPESYNGYLLHAKLRAARKSNNLRDLENFLKKLKKEHQLQDIINLKLGEWTPLHLALNWLKITKFLIKNGAEVRGTEGSFTPLHLASSNGHLAVIKYLIRKGANPKDTNEDGWTLLHAAAQNGQLCVVQYFIDKRKIDVNITDKKGTTPLHTAAFHGQLNVVKFLLSRKANINAVDVLGATPLFSAALHNNRDVRNFLLDIDATAINTNDNQTLIGMLNISVLHIAAAYDDEQIIQDLINKGVDKDIGRNTSLTPYLVARFFGSMKATQCLIANGAVTNTHIKFANIRKIFNEAENSALEPYSMPTYVSTLTSLMNFIHSQFNVIEVPVDIFECPNEMLTGILGSNFVRLIDSLKTYVEQRKNPDLNIPMHAIFFTQEGIEDSRAILSE